LAYCDASVQIALPHNLAQRLCDALRKAGSREIGGILMGEHLSKNAFVIKDITIQRQGGTFASFVRMAQDLVGFVMHFFQRTGHDYARFNYLGEWHSHPSFSPKPSSTDCETMWSIVEDPEVGANFAVLLILRLKPNDILEGSATVFLPSKRILSGCLILEEAPA